MLHVDYVRPTLIEGPLELRSQVKEIKGCKVVVSTTLSVQGQVCARGEVVATQLPEDWPPAAAPMSRQSSASQEPVRRMDGFLY